MAKIGVIGAGSWGTALSVLLHNNGNEVTVWSIDPGEVQMLTEKREHEKKLPGVKLPEDMQITGDQGNGKEDEPLRCRGADHRGRGKGD